MRTSLPLKAILEAQHQLRPHLLQTPLVFSRGLSEQFGAEILLKLECRQPTGSFKVRGALNKLSHLAQSGEFTGVITGSAGNHGLGVAFAAQALGIAPVTIVVPGTAPELKKEKLRRYTVEVLEVGQSYEAAHQAALQIADKHRWTYISAYDDVEVIAGQGTIGLEIMYESPDTDIVVVPVGGGGLIAGIANAVKQINPQTEIIGVQAAASPSAQLSLRDGEPYDPYEHEPTIADGLAGGFGKIPFYLARMLIDRIELATEQDLKSAVYHLLKEEMILAEPSGAISICPLAKGRASWRGKKVVCVISGGNLSLSLLGQILNEYAAQNGNLP